jgi:hypothetical protein
MTRRRLFLFAALAALGVASTVAFLWPRPRVTKESYERIKLGMTRPEVEALLGGPPGDYTSGPRRPTDDKFVQDVREDVREIWLRPGGTMLLPRHERWQGDAGDLGVSFDPAGRALEKYFLPYEREKQTPLDYLLRSWKRLVPQDPSP